MIFIWGILSIDPSNFLVFFYIHSIDCIPWFIFINGDDIHKEIIWLLNWMSRSRGIKKIFSNVNAINKDYTDEFFTSVILKEVENLD